MKRNVLLVEYDPELRDRMAGWVEEAGHQVMVCPGPSAPDYTCVASRGVPCALARAADLVVLDLWLASDSALKGTSSTKLLAYYLRAGKPVVAISPGRDHSRLVKLFLEEDMVLLDWPPDRRDLAETIGAVLHGDLANH